MATFPTTVLLSYPVIKTPTFETLIIGYGGGVEQRIKLSPTPRYKFKCTLESKETSDAETVSLFFEARGGSYESFYFRNPEECYGDRAWKPSTTYAVGQIVRPTTANGRSYKCTTAGASGSGEPTWPVTENGTVNDGAAVWTENSYTVRFMEDEINAEYFNYYLFTFGAFELIEG